MKKTLLCLLLLFPGMGAIKAQTFSSTGSVVIPDGGSGLCAPGTAASSAINVTATGTIATPADVTINVNLGHTWAGDLVVELVAPDGSSCNLINRLGKTDVCPADSDGGSKVDFDVSNTLSFKSSHSTPVPTSSSTGSIPAGNYIPTTSSSGSACNLATFLAGKSVNGNWAIRGTDYSNGTTGSISSWSINFGSTALPLNLLRFSGSAFEGYNRLEWETAAEKNTAFFAVQRSTNGTDYTTIAHVTAKGNHQYAYRDNEPTGDVCYYRLKMTDKDGTFSFSPTQRLLSRQRNSGGAVVLPNPAKGQINLTVEGNDLLGTQAAIVNLSGQTVQTFTIPQAKSTLDVAALPAGIYIIRFASGALLKFTKMD